MINRKFLAQLLEGPTPELGSIVSGEDLWNAKAINKICFFFLARISS